MTVEELPATDSEVRAYTRRFHNLYLFLTERCQLRCGHCYMGSRLERGQSFSLEEATHALRFFRNMGSDYVTFVGGEPSLHASLPDIVGEANTLGYRKIMLDSNGLLRERIARIPPRSLYYIRVSLDGASSSTHDRVRGKGNFDRTIASIRWLVEQGYSTRITTTLFSFNVHEIENLVNLAGNLGVRVVNLHIFSEEGCGRDKASWSISPDEWLSVCARIEGTSFNPSVEVRYPPTWIRKERLPVYEDRGYKGCLGCSMDRISVFPDGRCYICPLFFDHDNYFAFCDGQELVLNNADNNEVALYMNALLESVTPTQMGCPAERYLESKADTESLLSVCRLWRASV